MAKRPKKSDKPSDSAKKLAIETARIALDNNCEDIVVLDLRGVSPVTDFFVIATGTSGRQMRSAAEEITKYGKSIEQRPWHVAGLDSPDWIVLDFVDVVVHLFDESHRRYYDLELMWGDAPKVRWKKASPRKKANQAPEAGE